MRGYFAVTGVWREFQWEVSERFIHLYHLLYLHTHDIQGFSSATHYTLVLSKQMTSLLAFQRDKNLFINSYPDQVWVSLGKDHK